MKRSCEMFTFDYYKLIIVKGSLRSKGQQRFRGTILRKRKCGGRKEERIEEENERIHPEDPMVSSSTFRPHSLPCFRVVVIIVISFFLFLSFIVDIPHRILVAEALSSPRPVCTPSVCVYAQHNSV